MRRRGRQRVCVYVWMGWGRGRVEAGRQGARSRQSHHDEKVTATGERSEMQRRSCSCSVVASFLAATCYCWLRSCNIRTSGRPEYLPRPTTLFRDSLFQISGVRGNYPQLFVSVSSTPPTPPEFLGAWEKVEEMNELNDLPREVLEANPDIVTLDMVFGECEKILEGE